jgi:hypothetical protein
MMVIAVTGTIGSEELGLLKSPTVAMVFRKKGSAQLRRSEFDLKSPVRVSHRKKPTTNGICIPSAAGAPGYDLTLTLSWLCLPLTETQMTPVHEGCRFGLLFSASGFDEL